MEISVIIPVYNGDKYIGEALQSVLEQSYAPSEIIVVDDGSEDNTYNVVKKFGSQIAYYYQKHAGASAARNRGMLAASCDLVAFLDADDIWTPDKLRLQTEALLGNPSLDMVFGQVQQFYSPETDDEFRKSYHCPTQASPAPMPGTLLIKRSSFLKVGGFSTDFRTGEFIEWYGRAMEFGLQQVTISQTLMMRRIHYNNHGLSSQQCKQDYARVIKAMLQRKKAQGQ